MSIAIAAGSSAPAASRIMVVDDDQLIRAVILDILSSPEFDVVTATGARECLHHLREGFRGVILMDVQMPGVNGWDTIREIQQAGMLEGNIIVMLTAVEPPDERMEGLQEVVIDYIRKPFVSRDIIAAVRKYGSYLEQ